MVYSLIGVIGPLKLVMPENIRTEGVSGKSYFVYLLYNRYTNYIV